ncbi:50S ribosomal protein L29 [Patescibacteria group bacterium]|nr:50S ribosomal protein L29 [Patescibacteria group bacterium]
MKYKELKNKPKAELKRMLKENHEKLQDMRFKIANRSLKNVKGINNTKKIIARILTALGQENKNKEKK